MISGGPDMGSGSMTKRLAVFRDRRDAWRRAFFDMGLCGPTRADLANRTELCGQFKVPILHNVALTAPYFHNGAIATLEDAVAFYATRDSDPARWYPVDNGVAFRFNDLPAAYRGNVTQQAPFAQRPGAPARLSAQGVQDVVAFLRSLTDGFTPPALWSSLPSQP